MVTAKVTISIIFSERERKEGERERKKKGRSSE